MIVKWMKRLPGESTACRFLVKSFGGRERHYLNCLGLAYRQQGDYGETLVHFEQALDAAAEIEQYSWMADAGEPWVPSTLICWISQKRAATWKTP